MLRRTMFIGLVAAAIGSIWVAALLAQDGGRASNVAALTGWESVRTTEFTLEPNSSAELFAECPEGKVPLGGGFSKHPVHPDSEPGFEVNGSFPTYFTFEGRLFSGWIVHVLNRGTADAFVRAWATCAAAGTKAFH